MGQRYIKVRGRTIPVEAKSTSQLRFIERSFNKQPDRVLDAWSIENFSLSREESYDSLEERMKED